MRGRHFFALAALLLAPMCQLSGADQGTADPKPSFRMEANAAKRLIALARQIKTGDSLETVTKKLGRPVSDDIALKKESNTRVARVFRYPLLIWESGLVNEIHDRYIEVIFGDDDRVRKVLIRAQGME